MTLRELYLACNNVEHFDDVHIWELDRLLTLDNFEWKQPVLDREVKMFKVSGKIMEVWLV